jgi:2-aminobenzoate-CoA ligase
MGLVPGNRVLLRGANTPMMAACWFGVIKAGGIAVGTMPLLRERELQPIVDKAQRHARAVRRAAGRRAARRAGLCPQLAQLRSSTATAARVRWKRMAAQPATFDTVDTAADDTALIAFTSGTTGVPKGTMHFHRDVIAACRCWPPHVLRATPMTASSAARRWPSPSGWAGC